MPLGGNMQERIKTFVTAEKAAKMVGSHPAMVYLAKSFLKKADPALVKLVEEPGSKLSLNAACWDT